MQNIDVHRYLTTVSDPNSQLQQFTLCKWSKVNEMFNACMFCTEKTEDDMEREAQLLEWRLTLTEERNAVMVPSAGSGIPGAPAEWYSPLNDVLIENS